MLATRRRPRAGTGAWTGGILAASAIFLHGALGLPAPQTFGPVEAAVGACLLGAVGGGAVLRLATGALLTTGAPYWIATGAGCFGWLFWIPLMRGVAAGHEVEDVVRDVVPLGFLFLPLLLAPRLSPAGPRAVDVLAAALALAGVLLAGRWLLFGPPAGPAPERYLPNDPAVLFAAVWLPIAGFRFARRLSGWPCAALLGIAGAACLLVLVLQLNRSASFAAASALIVAFVWLWPSAKLAGTCVLAAVAAFAWARADLVASVADAFVAKTQAFGTNGRLLELNAVVERSVASWDGLLFGAGWGALLRNPAVGDWWVSYVHGLPGYLLFKTGLVGCLAAVLWTTSLLPVVLRMMRRDAGLGLAVIVPLLVGGLAHTGYKYLCFGLLLTVLVLAGGNYREEENQFKDERSE